MKSFSLILLAGCASAYSASGAGAALLLTLPLVAHARPNSYPAPPAEGPPPTEGQPPADPNKPPEDELAPVCFLKSYGRGVGKVPSHKYCSNPEHVIQDSLCYKKCPSGYKGRGPVCWKGIKSSRRGVGKAIKIGCKKGKTKDAGLCYTPCKEGYKGVGPMCWGSRCPATHSSKFGLLCAVNKEEGRKAIKSIVGDSASAVRDAMSNPMSVLGNAINMAKLLKSFPSCTNPKRKRSGEGDAGGAPAGGAPGGGAEVGQRLLELETKMSGELSTVKETLAAIANKMGVPLPSPPPNAAGKEGYADGPPAQPPTETAPAEKAPAEKAPAEKAPGTPEQAPPPQ